MEQFKGFRFRGQNEGEIIIKVIRRHWFNILQQYFFVFAAIFMLVTAFWIAPSYYDLSGPSGFSMLIFIISTIAIIIWLFSFVLWIDYYFDIWIITDERVIDIEQKGLFVRHVSELEFLKIQDVSVKVVGLIPTVLNYGDVHIQTAATEGKFLFRKVPNPYKIKSLLMKMQTFVNKNKKPSPFTQPEQ